MPTVTVIACRAEPHIPRGSADASWRLVDALVGDIVLATVGDSLSKPEEIAFGFALATQAHKMLVDALTAIATGSFGDSASAGLARDTLAALGKLAANGDEEPKVVIWHTPYKPPQQAIGTYTLAEAKAFFEGKGAPFDAVRLDLDMTGVCDRIVGYHAEYDA